MPTLYPRYDTLPVDDTDSRFQYGGSWSEVGGSSRQWNSGVTLTQQTGATVSFSFVGSDAFLYHTIPNGSGNVVVDISVDGGSPVRVTRTCGTQPVYDDIFYKTPIMTDAIKHTVVVTNRGSSNIPFMFDKVDLHAQDFATMLAPAQAPALTAAPPVHTTTAPPLSSATGSSPLSSTPAVATKSDQAPTSAQDTALSALPVSGASLVNNSASTSGSITVSSRPSSGLTAAPAQSSTVIVTTDARGATVTQTKAIGGISVSEIPGAIQTGKNTNGKVGAADKMPTPIAVILAIAFGIVAILLVLFFITICIHRRRKAREKAQLANNPERNLMAPNPFRLESEPPFAGSDSEAGYAVGSAAVYRDEKRPYDYNLSNVTLDASIANADQQVQAGSAYARLSRSGHSLARESDVGLPASTNGNFHHGNMSPIVERDSTGTAFESAPPAYHDNSRTSIGTSFYQQSTR